MTGLERLVRTTPVMGTVASVHVLADPAAPEALISPAMAAALDELQAMDALFSPFRPDSEVSLLRDGRRGAGSSGPLLREVAEACALLTAQSGGRFDAHRDGWFDPTGYVKGWAVERATERHLRPLLAEPGVVAAGLSAGGDMQLLTAPDADWTWRVGIADPRRPGAVGAAVRVRDGAVATSGAAERGAHIVDPRTGTAVAGAATATVIAERLSDADAWATIAVVAGYDDLTWLRSAPDSTGMLMAADGRVRRWAHGVEIADAADVMLPG